MSKVDAPTYLNDITGEIKRWDERDIVFARKDLLRYFGADSTEYRAYYEIHREHLEFDTKKRPLPELGKSAGIDLSMSGAQFDTIKVIGSEAIVDGQPASVITEIPPHRAAEKVKALAYILGADLVKIGPLRQEWVYSYVGRTIGNREGYHKRGTSIDLSRHTNAIVLGFKMDFNLMHSGPDFPVMLATEKGTQLAPGSLFNWHSISASWAILHAPTT